jgi:hypothetical protein
MLYLIEQCLNGIQLGMLLFLLAAGLTLPQLLKAEALRDGTHKWQLEQGYEMGRPSDLFLQGAARYTRSSLRFRRNFLARRPLQLLTFRPIRYRFCIHQSVFNPAYFSISFLSPCPGKLTVSFASSPSPSRLTITPFPYLG